MPSAAAPGQVLFGANWGGCFTCTTTGDTRGELLNSTDLAEACLARCLGDPRCRRFEVAAPPINAYQKAVSSGRFNFEANRCIEHHAADDPAVAELVVTHDGAAADLCKGEAACWTGYELSGTCDAQPAWAASAALRCYSSEENCGQAGANRLKIDEAAEFVKEKGCAGHVHQLFHHCLEEWKGGRGGGGDEYAWADPGPRPRRARLARHQRDGRRTRRRLAVRRLARRAAARPLGRRRHGVEWGGRAHQPDVHKIQVCIDMEPHWRAVDVDGDMMLNASEVASLLERLQRIITIKDGAEAGEDLTSFPSGSSRSATAATTGHTIDTWGQRGDAKLSMDEFFGGVGRLANAGEPPCPGGGAAARATAAMSTASTP